VIYVSLRLDKSAHSIGLQRVFQLDRCKCGIPLRRTGEAQAKTRFIGALVLVAPTTDGDVFAVQLISLLLTRVTLQLSAITAYTVETCRAN
jgi:hypothetical protein